MTTSQKQASDVSEWWVTTGVQTSNGRKVLGPFVSRDLALTVRNLMERDEGHHGYWIEEFDAQGHAR